MVSAANHQLGIGQRFRHILECFNHQLQPLISSPLAEGQNAMFRIAAAGKIRIFGFSGKNAVGSQMNIVAAILLVQYLAVSGHQHRDGVRHEKHLRGKCAGQAVAARMTHTSVFQVHRIHQMVQGYVGVTAGKARKHRREKSGECDEWFAPECAEEKIEPNHIRFQSSNHAQDANCACRIVEGPATLDGEVLEFRASA